MTSIVFGDGLQGERAWVTSTLYYSLLQSPLLNNGADYPEERGPSALLQSLNLPEHTGGFMFESSAACLADFICVSACLTRTSIVTECMIHYRFMI